MWKHLVSLLVLLAIGGLGAAQLQTATECANCYANIVTQDDRQTIDHVRIAPQGSEWVAIGNEGLTSGIIVTPKFKDGEYIKDIGFARIDQAMDQTVSNLGPDGVITDENALIEGAKGITWNKAIQAAWIAGEGRKENETVVASSPVWKKEGAYIGQSTKQIMNKIVDYDSREKAKLLNVDNKLAMIVDNLTEQIDIIAKASSATTDNASSTGSIKNDVYVNITATDD